MEQDDPGLAPAGRISRADRGGRPGEDALFAYVRARVEAYVADRGLAFADGQDLLQSVFELVWIRWERFEPDPARASWRTWASRQVDYGIRGFWRRRQRDDRVRAVEHVDGAPDDGTAEPWTEAYRAELAAHLAHCAAELPDRVRRRFEAWYAARQDGDRLAALADRMELKLGTLKQSVKRARRALRECLRRRGVDLTRRGPGRPS